MKYDIIGDIHGCWDEYRQLTEKLGYEWNEGVPVHSGRQLVFLGDLTDRGPESVKMMEHVYELVSVNKALYVPGNHCNKLYRYLIGRNVTINYGLETTVAEIQNLRRPLYKKVKEHFISLYEKAPLYLVLDGGKLVVSHAGIREDLIGKQGKQVKTFVLYGDITGKHNPDGTPERRDWAAKYSGKAYIVYGHTPVQEPRELNNTINIDTGCVFGNRLTALRYPEKELISVSSSMPYAEEKFRSFSR
ncbi:bis(5'-nucleosyl)-tetraphosphatase PrpE [Fictibacillus enclensis]|uniref:bis(5'-nucleosyl)-tetraphosphatase PrpE n=1 Tax=Fictibacillus enclensis TaxID=1017270 RepID=UPI0024BF4646|nr:bis(5'-nucleosyl)-tetraphosphatase PrpE [Fictibacillus enclensis]MDM5337844.1 bis(5'-nucleosyl)-tetraphosphatase PrpE [Fictibacillus enclensis]WHY74205.1 bis(5'-nucleosyl)-tetraphosphatase PrpE [Fictibacillus enclensis]